MTAFVASNATWNTTAGNKGVSPTPAVGELLVAFVAESGLTTGYAVSDNQTGGTYTQIGSFALNNTSVDSIGVWIRDNLVSSAVAHAINTTGATASTGGGLAVLRVSGMTKAGSAAVRSVAGTAQFAKQENQAAGTPAPVFPAAALAANMVVGAVLTASNSTTNTAPPTNWTERHDLGYTTPATGLEVATRDSGETGTTISWTGATPTGFASIIIELDTSQPFVMVGGRATAYSGTQGQFSTPPYSQFEEMQVPGRSMLSRIIRYPAFVAGTTFNQTCAVGLTGTVAVVKQANKITAVALTGTVAASRQVSKGVSVALTGTVATSKRVSKAVAVAGTYTVAQTKTVTKAVAVGLTGTASIVKQVAKNVAATFTAAVAVDMALVAGTPVPTADKVAVSELGEHNRIAGGPAYG